MSYQISVYFNDSDIYSTRIYGVNGNVNLTKYYGDTAYIASGFSGTTKFTATPADGCVFTRWVYRIGGDSGEQQYSYENPFSYNGTEDIIIRAEGEVGDPGGGGDDTEEWKYYHTIVGTIPEFYEDTETYVPKYIVQVFQFRFERDGIAKFYSFLSGDTIGYLSDSLGIDETSGEPSGNILAQNDDDNGWEFGFEYEVSAYTTYYLYVRHQFGDTGGYIQIGIEAPTDPSANLPTVNKWSWVTSWNGEINSTIKTRARNAVRDKTATTNFDHRVWNALVDKVYEIVDKCGYGWDSYYETYSRTLMNTSPYELMADMFNSLRYNIGIHYSTGIQEVDPGDIVYGEYFLTLATCINEWIDQLRNDGILAQPT